MRLEARLRRCNPNTPNSFSERILGGAQARHPGTCGHTYVRAIRDAGASKPQLLYWVPWIQFHLVQV